MSRILIIIFFEIQKLVIRWIIINFFIIIWTIINLYQIFRFKLLEYIIFIIKTFFNKKKIINNNYLEHQFFDNYLDNKFEYNIMIIIFLNIVSHMYHNLQIFESIELIIKFSLIYNIYNKNIFHYVKNW